MSETSKQKRFIVTYELKRRVRSAVEATDENEALAKCAYGNVENEELISEKFLTEVSIISEET
jgi:hypothetical protein